MIVRRYVSAYHKSRSNFLWRVQDSDGGMVGSWVMVSASEERLLLHQFLRFDETRPIAQHLILQQALQVLSVATATNVATATAAATRPLGPELLSSVDCHRSQLGFLSALQMRHVLPFASVHSRNTSLPRNYAQFLSHQESGVDPDDLEMVSE